MHKRQGGNQEHEHYEQLCALAVGGLMESAEIVDFQTHLRGCSECRSDYEELSSVLAFVLPQAQKTFQQNLAESRTKPLPDSRQRFLRRARTEGVVFSREIEVPVRSSPWYFRPVAMSAAVAGLVLIAVSLPIYHLREAPRAAGATDAAAAQQIAELKRENSALAANLSRLSDSVAAGERQIPKLALTIRCRKPATQQGTARSRCRTIRQPDCTLAGRVPKPGEVADGSQRRGGPQ